jgi:hypothetical protein
MLREEHENDSVLLHQLLVLSGLLSSSTLCTDALSHTSSISLAYEIRVRPRRLLVQPPRRQYSLNVHGKPPCIHPRLGTPADGDARGRPAEIRMPSDARRLSPRCQPAEIRFPRDARRLSPRCQPAGIAETLSPLAGNAWQCCPCVVNFDRSCPCPCLPLLSGLPLPLPWPFPTPFRIVF